MEDETTRLVYARATNSAGLMTYAEASMKAESLSVLGLKWRVPTLVELTAIVDLAKYNPAFKHPYFQVDSGRYWTSTPAAWCNGRHWAIHSYTGSMDCQELVDVCYLLAVASPKS